VRRRRRTDNEEPENTAIEIAIDGFGCFTGWAHRNFMFFRMRVTRGWQRRDVFVAMGLLSQSQKESKNY
jgi:hypothetical protein